MSCWNRTTLDKNTLVEIQISCQCAFNSMNDRLTLKKHLIAIGVVSALTILWAFAESAVFYPEFNVVNHAEPVTRDFSILRNICIWCPWIVLTPALMVFNRRFPFRKHKTKKAITAHIIGAVIFGSIKSIIESLLIVSIVEPSAISFNFDQICSAVIIYWLFPAIYNGVLYYKSYIRL